MDPTTPRQPEKKLVPATRGKDQKTKGTRAQNEYSCCQKLLIIPACLCFPCIACYLGYMFNKAGQINSGSSSGRGRPTRSKQEKAGPETSGDTNRGLQTKIDDGALTPGANEPLKLPSRPQPRASGPKFKVGYETQLVTTPGPQMKNPSKLQPTQPRAD